MRLINFNIDFDVECFAKWADTVGIRSEFINFALLQPEIFTRKKNINARSYVMFANACSGMVKLDTEEALEQICLISKGCFNDEWVSGMFIQFVHNKLDKLINPKDMLQGEWKDVKAKLIDNIYRNGGKYDASVASTLTLRFSNYVENYFTTSTEKGKSDKVIDRIIDICTSDKTLFTEDLLYRLIKHLYATQPQRCQKMLKYSQIKAKLL